MKNLLVVFCIVLLVPLIGLGQEKEQGYLFAAPSAFLSTSDMSGLIHFGGGGEFHLYKGLGIGAEIGYLTALGHMDSGIGVLSLNGFFPLRRVLGNKAVPFVTGGYSLLFRRRYMNAVNFGGGINYWFTRKTALRLEFRDHVNPRYSGTHLVQVRIGITLR